MVENRAEAVIAIAIEGAEEAADEAEARLEAGIGTYIDFVDKGGL